MALRERFKLKEAVYQKKIEDAQKANEDLRRKLEQGSQQLQGEVLELELESILKNAFPFDMRGELQAIADESLPQLDSIAMLPAPDIGVEAKDEA